MGMAGVAELATTMMIAAHRRIAVTANNIANISTPSYKTRRVFSQIVEMRDQAPVDVVSIVGQSQARALKLTGDAMDVATDGNGAFLFRVDDFFRSTNSAQLHRDDDGRLVDNSGAVLQTAGGGDLIVGPGTPAILRDGTLLIDGQAVGRIGVFAGMANGEELISSLLDAAEEPVVHQGYLSPSDVDSAGEMVELTKAGRLAETGARVFQIYDDLTGRVAAKLGELGR